MITKAKGSHLIDGDYRISQEYALYKVDKIISTLSSKLQATKEVKCHAEFFIWGKWDVLDISIAILNVPLSTLLKWDIMILMIRMRRR